VQWRLVQGLGLRLSHSGLLALSRGPDRALCLPLSAGPRQRCLRASGLRRAPYAAPRQELGAGACYYQSALHAWAGAALCRTSRCVTYAGAVRGLAEAQWHEPGGASLLLTDEAHLEGGPVILVHVGPF